MTTIMVIDDSRTIRMIASKLLRVHGFAVREAENGQEGIEACRREMPDGILLDWNMPVMNGPSFLNELRKTPGGGAPKVLFCTTESDIDKISAVLSAGANEFIMKPFDEEILVSKLDLVGLHGEESSDNA